MEVKPELSILPGRFAVFRLDARAPVPGWAGQGGFCCAVRTDEELSIVCEERYVPEGVLRAGGRIALKVRGPLDFSITGLIAAISGALAKASVSIFAVSTYDTDYILINEADREKAAAALKKAGFPVRL